MQEEEHRIWNDLSTKGYCVVPSFFDSDLCALFVAEFRKTDEKTPRLENEALLEVARTRVMKCNLEPPYGPSFGLSAYFFGIERGVNHGFHRDHGTFYVNQSHKNMLFIWIPIAKPSETLSNLSLLERGDWFAPFVDGGASRVENGMIVDDQTGESQPLPKDAKVKRL
jgi:hypothetical protein